MKLKEMKMWKVILATSSLLFGDVLYGQENLPRSAATTSRVASAARTYAEALADPSTEDFARLFRLAFALGMGDESNSSEIPIERQLGSSRASAGVEADRRYQTNLTELSKDKDKIWGGKRVAPGDYPDVVAIRGPGGFCTGSLISADAVLTARHCLCGDVDSEVIFGDDVQSPRQVVTVDAVKTDKASQCIRTLDFSVLFLSQPVDITPRRLAIGGWIDKATIVRAVGFGRTEDPVSEPSGIKREVDVPVASPACNGHVDLVSGPKEDSMFYKCVRNAEIVAGTPLLNRDSCNGDSGGPIFIAGAGDDHTLYLAGLTSRAVSRPGYRPCGDGGIYVRSDGEVLKWLTEHGVGISIGAVTATSVMDEAPQPEGPGDRTPALATSQAQPTTPAPTADSSKSPQAPKPTNQTLVISGTLTDLPDGRVAVVPSAPNQPVTVVSGSEIPPAAKELPVKVRLEATPSGYSVERLQLTAQAHWDETKRQVPAAAKAEVDRAYQELARALGEIVNSDSDRSVLAEELDNVQAKLVTAYNTLQNAPPKARRAVLANYRDIVESRKAIYGGSDIYPPAAYDRIYKASRAVGALARREDVPFCSGALIGRDLFLTALHCTTDFPTELEVRFNFERDLAGTALAEDRYPVLAYEIIGSMYPDTNEPLDFAILRLGSNKEGQEAGDKWAPECLSNRRVGLQVPIYVIGHPQGESRKVHDNARVYFPFRVTQAELNDLLVSVEAEFIDDPEGAEKLQEFARSYRKRGQRPNPYYENYSVKWRGPQPVMGADTDTFHGNSGSPVFDRKTHHAVGIFVVGEPDGLVYNAGWRHHEGILPMTEVIKQMREQHEDWLRQNNVCILD